MTSDRTRHPEFEELISASLHGDLTADERRRLDAHLDGCPTCRATLAAFSDQRRIMTGLRHVAPPRDLGARVRAGVERHEAGRRWWQRPPVIFASVGGGLAVVAGALLALVLLNDSPDDPNIGLVSPTPTASGPALSSTPIPTLPDIVTPAPSQPAASAAPSVSAQPAPTATPIQASPEPDSYLAVTGPPDNQAMTLRDGTTGETLREVETPPGVPIAAELSPNGEWLAYIAQVGTGSGLTEVRATRVADGATVALGNSVDGNPFAEHLFWSPDGRYLAFTLVDPDPDAASTDAWIFDVTTAATSRLTDVGNAYAGSWVPGDRGGALLWLSTAGEEPRSYLRLFHEDEDQIATLDPQDGPYPAANVFQPIVSPNGGYVIYWIGRMAPTGDEYEFVSGGAPWLALNRPNGERGFDFADSRPVFTDVPNDLDAFSSAAIQWSLNGDAFAVWEAAWAGIPLGSEEEYPDPTRVYLGRTSDGRHVTRIHALDAADLPPDATVVDVKVSGTGRHLAVTARYPVAGQELPQADLLLVTRNFENVADDVLDLEPDKEGWFGPAVFNAAEWAELVGD